MGVLIRGCPNLEVSTPSSLVRGELVASCLLRHFRSIFAVAISCLLGAAVTSSLATAQSQGITIPQIFPAHDTNAPRCRPPEGRQKALAFAQDNDRSFMQGVNDGLSLAAKDRGLAYQVAVARNDAARMISDVEGFFAARIGAVVAAPVEFRSSEPKPEEADLGWCLRWHGGAAAGRVDSQCATISDRKSAGGRRRGTYTPAPLRQG